MYNFGSDLTLHMLGVFLQEYIKNKFTRRLTITGQYCGCLTTMLNTMGNNVHDSLPNSYPILGIRFIGLIYTFLAQTGCIRKPSRAFDLPAFSQCREINKIGRFQISSEGWDCKIERQPYSVSRLCTRIRTNCPNQGQVRFYASISRMKCVHIFPVYGCSPKN